MKKFFGFFKFHKDPFIFSCILSLILTIAGVLLFFAGQGVSLSEYIRYSLILYFGSLLPIFTTILKIQSLGMGNRG